MKNPSVKIVSDGTLVGTKVFSNGKEIKMITNINIEIDVNGSSYCYLKILNPEINITNISATILNNEKE